MVFYVEIFYIEEDELILCEIVSCVGGFKIGIILKMVFNIDLMKIWV